MRWGVVSAWNAQCAEWDIICKLAHPLAWLFRDEECHEAVLCQVHSCKPDLRVGRGCESLRFLRWDGAVHLMTAARWCLKGQTKPLIGSLDDSLDVGGNHGEGRDGEGHLALCKCFGIWGNLRNIGASYVVGHTKAVRDVGQYISDIGRYLEGVLRWRIKVFYELELEGHICDIADGDIDGCHFLDFVVTLEVTWDREKDRHMRNMYISQTSAEPTQLFVYAHCDELAKLQL